MFELVGHAGPGRRAAATVMAVETRLSQGHWERAETRDVQKTYNLLTLEELHALCPAFDWEAFIRNLGGSEETIAETCIRQPSYLEHLSTALEEVPIEDWRAWLVARVVRAVRAVPHRRSSSRPTSTSTAAPSAARRSCASAGSAASLSSRARSARRSAASTSPVTSRRRPRR